MIKFVEKNQSWSEAEKALVDQRVKKILAERPELRGSKIYATHAHKEVVQKGGILVEESDGLNIRFYKRVYVDHIDL